MQVNKGERKVVHTQLVGSPFLPAGLGTRTRLEPKDRVEMILEVGGALRCSHKGKEFLVPAHVTSVMVLEEHVQATPKDK